MRRISFQNHWDHQHAESHCHLPTMLHVLWFVHADGQFDLEVVVLTAFRHRHLVQLRLFGTVGSRMEHNLQQSHNNHVCELCTVWRFHQVKWPKYSRSVVFVFFTFPSSLSSRANTPVLSVNSFTFTAGNGWVVVKSPWVPQLHTHTPTHTQTQLQQERKHFVREDDVSEVVLKFVLSIQSLSCKSEP